MWRGPHTTCCHLSSQLGPPSPKSPRSWRFLELGNHVGWPYHTLQGEGLFMVCSGSDTLHLCGASCPCGPHAQEALLRLGLTHSLEPGWGRRPGLVPAPLPSAESGKHGRKRGRNKDEILFAQHLSLLIYFTFVTTLGDSISQPLDR